MKIAARSAVLIIAGLSLMSGCRGRGFFAPQGTINEQQAQAVIHDPFPSNDIFPYDATVRPPDYPNPLPEPVRNRISRDAFGN